jgi:tripartite-type tricarboxylate transporter receptor subunit TctC
MSATYGNLHTKVEQAQSQKPYICNREVLVEETNMPARLFCILAIVLLTIVDCGAQTPAQIGADQFPNRAVRIVVPFPPGGPTDVMARAYAHKLSEMWGQPVTIENRPGGDSSIGAQAVARAAADGYTLLVAMDNTLVLNPITTRDLAYNVDTDFAYISMLAQNTSLLIVNADGPATVPELIVKAKANAGKLNYGAGILTTRLAAFMFTKLAGIQAVYIPYKGSAEVVQGLLTRSIDFSVDGVAASLSLIQSGKLRALAKLNTRPLSPLPDLKPLAQEASLPALGEISTWAGLVAPADTPPAIVERIQRDVAKIATDPDVSQALIKVGVVTVSSTPAEFVNYVKTEQRRWSEVFKSGGFTLN